jgi:hypothetical protein
MLKRLCSKPNLPKSRCQSRAVSRAGTTRLKRAGTVRFAADVQPPAAERSPSFAPIAPSACSPVAHEKPEAKKAEGSPPDSFRTRRRGNEDIPQMVLTSSPSGGALRPPSNDADAPAESSTDGGQLQYKRTRVLPFAWNGQASFRDSGSQQPRSPCCKTPRPSAFLNRWSSPRTPSPTSRACGSRATRGEPSLARQTTQNEEPSLVRQTTRITTAEESYAPAALSEPTEPSLARQASDHACHDVNEERTEELARQR